jgi:hypothetical protein
LSKNPVFLPDPELTLYDLLNLFISLFPQVLVLEAGAEPTFLTHSPFFNVFNWNNNATTWGYYSIPQQDACIACRRKVSSP